MNRSIPTLMAFTLAGLGLTSPAAAQIPLGIELRANGAIATQDAGRETHENGFGFEGNLQYDVLSSLAVYAGWDWNRFSALNAIAGPDTDLKETGYVLGLRYERPFQEGSRMAWWARFGGTYNHLELENSDGDLIDDSGHGFGLEAGAGVSVPFGGYWSLTPGIRYRKLSRDLEIDNLTTPVKLESLAFEVGLGLHF